MKIGILTFHRAHNYGAVLQAYAMKTIFSRYGQAELIDYWPDYHRGDYDLMDFRFLVKGLCFRQRLVLFRASIKRTLLLPLRLRRHGKFKSFIDTHFLSSTRKVVRKESELPKDFDAYIYGSDQIWRVYDIKNFPRPDLVYLGNGVPAGRRKIAYAASMGEVKNETLHEPKVQSLLGEFDSLGVREKTLQHAIAKFCSRPVKQVLDPTLLVSREDWADLADTTPYNNKCPYLLFYSLIDSPVSRVIANKLASNLGLLLIEINGFETITGVLSKNLLQTAGPIDFLQLVRNAEFVVSTSFHGVVFSILFHKQFYVCGMGRHADRVTSLLDLLDLRDRLIEDESSADVTAIIDYETVDLRLSDLVAQSELFIRTALF
ncbi:MAG: polysaccharide pyruvyl transferase family protein [Pseudomonadota bacterium]